MLRISAGMIAALFVVAGCSQKEAETSAFSHPISKNALRSEAFGLTVEKPEGWRALDQGLQEQLADQGTKVASSGNERLAAQLEAGKSRNHQIFGVFKFEPGAAVQSNPNVVAVAEDVRLAPGIKRGRDYLFHFRHLMAQANTDLKFEEDIAVQTIGGREFDRIDGFRTGTGMKQSFFAARRGDYVVLLIQSYRSDLEKEETDAVIASIRFNKAR